MCVETGEIFECIKYAKEKYGIKSDGSLTVALKNPTRTAAKCIGYIYKIHHVVALHSDMYWITQNMLEHPKGSIT